MICDGFIKLHRKMLDWEWYTDVNTKVLFLHCLLKANFKTKKYQSNTVKRGSFVTSLDSLSKETGLTVRQIRTALEHLITTGELTSNSSNKNRIITVVNYEKYQDTDKQNDKQMTSNRQSSDNQPTTVEERKERKNISSSPSGKKICGGEKDGVVKKGMDKVVGKKMKWSFGDVKEFAKTVKGGDDYNACDFRRGFVKSGTAFPDNWQDVFRSFAAAGLEAQDEFLKKLESGAYISKWGEGVWS